MKQLVKAGRPVWSFDTDIVLLLSFQLWLVIFPEGTRYNILKEDAIKKSQQYAKDNGKIVERLANDIVSVALQACNH